MKIAGLRQLDRLVLAPNELLAYRPAVTPKSSSSEAEHLSGARWLPNDLRTKRLRMTKRYRCPGAHPQHATFVDRNGRPIGGATPTMKLEEPMVDMENRGMPARTV